jgi:UDP-N-acetylglucosamine 1-carboxyvinyltransferase
MLVNGSQLKAAEIEVLGFKHAFVSVVAACVACRGRLTVRNAPDIAERAAFVQLLRHVGCRAEVIGTHFHLDCSTLSSHRLDLRTAARIHGAMYLVPALAAALGKAELDESGGCAIGDGVAGRRPTSHMVQVLKAFGVAARSTDRAGIVATGGTLHPAEIDIKDFSQDPTILTGPHISGATKTALICAAGVQTGESSTIANPYAKPDVTDLVRYLTDAGLSISWERDTIRVVRTGPVCPVEMDLTPDLSEVITYLTLSIIAGCRITVRASGMHRALEGLSPEIRYLDRLGVVLKTSEDSVSAYAPTRLRSVDIDVTSVGIYSDHQPFFALLLTRGDRPATIREFVWKNRFSYVNELRAFGVQIESLEGGVRIHPSKLCAPKRPIIAKDLRTAAVLLVAGLSVAHPVKLSGLDHLERGYSGIWEKLKHMGAIFVPETACDTRLMVAI